MMTEPTPESLKEEKEEIKRKMQNIRSKMWRINNPEKLKEIYKKKSARYYQEHKAELNAKRKLYKRSTKK